MEIAVCMSGKCRAQICRREIDRLNAIEKRSNAVRMEKFNDMDLEKIYRVLG